MIKPLPIRLDERRIDLRYEDGAFVAEIEDHPVNRIKLRSGLGLVVAGIITGIGYFWNPVLGLIGMPFLLLGGLLAATGFQSSRERRLELERGELTIRRFSMGIPRGESKMTAANLVDVIAENGGVHLFDATQTVTLPNLEGSANEVARQIRVHVGMMESEDS